ncbi:histidine kinase [Streptomyces albus subsp. albus]|nr:histidine kinase [Streptomyces albus subsp. albus]
MVRVALVAVMVALVLLATPLAVVIRQSFFADERGELERMALAATVRVGPRFAAGDAVELSPPEAGSQLGVYDAALRLRDGTGPRVGDPVTRRAATGVVAQGTSDGRLVAAVPVSAGEHVVGVVRASTSTGEVWGRVELTWLGLLGAVLLALGTAVLVARHQARRLTAPLEALSTRAEAVAGGDLTARAARSEIGEIDQVARTQNTMVDRLTTLLEHERRFSANASHQLRTPLTGLQLGLEAAASGPDAGLRAAVDEALEQSRHLHETVDEVLRLAWAAPAADRREGEAPQPVSVTLERVERRWHGAFADAGRRLDITVPAGAGALPVPDRTVEQVLDVLLDNALGHGRGAAQITVREMGEAVAIDIADEGTLRLDPVAAFERGATTGGGAGIGLHLAREMAEAAGGRLTLARTAPTTFTLLLPPLPPR